MDNKNSFDKSRRRFLYNLGLTALSIPAVSWLADYGMYYTEKESRARIKRQQASGKLGIALVGLGGYAGGQLAPALQQTDHCYLAGIVTGTPSKAEKWKSQYGIPPENVYDYKSFDKIKDNPAIDIVYVVLPNSMHPEYVIRAAQASKHVISEKPMAIAVEDCDKMIAACKKAGKMLSIGYRLHFEPYNLEMARLGQQKIYGPLNKMNGSFGFNIDKGVWRLNKEMAGGGPLVDVGIYCIQAACYTSGMEPIAVKAQEGIKHDMERFKEVEESLTWQMEMPGGITAECKASYGEGMNNFRAEAKKGWFELSPAFNYSNLSGETSGGKMNLPNINQQAKQMDAFAQSIKNKQPSIVPGEMGKRDVKIINAIYEAMRTGARVKV